LSGMAKNSKLNKMELKTVKREVLGRKVKSLRAKGWLPAELYGRGTKNEHISVLINDFKSVFKRAGESTVINLIVDDKPRPVLIYDYKINPLTHDFQSVDFYEVKMDEQITATTPIVFVGEAPAVKEKGGVLIKAMDEIEVEALPANLPHELIVDLNSLTEIGQSLFVKDIKIKGDFKILVDLETVVATISEPGVEEEEEAPISVEEVLVESELKKSERKQKAAEETEKTK